MSPARRGRRPIAGATFVVTGGSSGIGAATTKLLRERGATVVTIDRADDADHRIDVTDPLTVRATFDEVAAAHDGIDGVVHSAGILATGAFCDLDVERQLQLVDVNLGGTISVAHAALVHLRKSRGSLVLLGSASGFQGAPEYATYGATKAAIISLVQALRIELEDDDVHVATCNPLFTSTPMLGAPSEGASLVKSMGPAHTPEQVAAAIVRGIERRSAMIHPNIKVRAMHAAGLWIGAFGHPIMRTTWRRSRRAPAAPSPDRS